ncbi:facilitated trehalose transporter Tret1-like [Ptiloglossa arizonensis]|uniref:facilitated trehalose transporter Tret1-like n=1 Tax=Ptiloglossa arizonensis TaxID=3350558 RepID=UPI003F9F76A0
MTLQIMETWLGVWPQWVAGLTVTLLSVSLGLVVGWTSPYTAQLTDKNSTTFHITERQASWVASLLPVGRMFGACTGWLGVDYFGSKRTLLFAGGPVLIGWICIIAANSAEWLYVSRFSAGISVGMFLSSFSLYIGEIASPSIRGGLVTMIINGIPFGMMIGNAMGSQLPMAWFGAISSIVNLCYIVFLLFLPRSPYFYVHRNDLDEAKKTIQWYRRKLNVAEELEIIQTFVQSSKATTFVDKLKKMTERKNRNMLVLVLMLFIIMQLSGLHSVVFYMEIIVTKAKVTAMRPPDVVVLSGVFGIIVGWVGVYLMDRSSRRLLMAVSCTGIIIAMSLLGLNFTLLDLEYDPKNLEWMTILALLVFTLLNVGVGPIPSTMLAELFPADLKSMAGFVCSFVSALFAFVSSKTYHLVTELMTDKLVFWMYALIMICSLVYSIVNVPETKGKTLQEIQEMLSGEYEEEV